MNVSCPQCSLEPETTTLTTGCLGFQEDLKLQRRSIAFRRFLNQEKKAKDSAPCQQHMDGQTDQVFFSGKVPVFIGHTVVDGSEIRLTS